MAKIHRREIQKEVRIGLDPTEREPLVKDLLKHLKKSESLKLQAADTQAGFRKDIKEVKDLVDECRASLERGRPVIRDVEEIKNFSAGTVKYKDIETGRIVEEREMDEDDRQMAIGENAGEEDPDAPAPKKGKKGDSEEAASGPLHVAH